MLALNIEDNKYVINNNEYKDNFEWQGWLISKAQEIIISLEKYAESKTY